MDKYLCKQMLKKSKLPLIPYAYQNKTLTELPKPFQFPVILKPLNQGSSIGVHLIKNEKELYKVSKNLQQQYHHYLLESFITGREISVGVLDYPQYTVLPILELKSANAFYDYEAKYTKGLSTFHIPAPLSPQLEEKIKQLALKAHQKSACFGVSRVDFRISEDNEPFILELNTLPGLTETSDLPAQAAALNMSFLDLILNLLHAAYARYERQN